MSRLRLLRLRLRGVTCANWPCARCDREGRGGWRSRQAWHDARRARRIERAWQALAAGGALLLAFTVYVAWWELTR